MIHSSNQTHLLLFASCCLLLVSLLCLIRALWVVAAELAQKRRFKRMEQEEIYAGQPPLEHYHDYRPAGLWCTRRLSRDGTPLSLQQGLLLLETVKYRSRDGKIKLGKRILRDNDPSVTGLQSTESGSEGQYHDSEGYDDPDEPWENAQE